MNKNDDIIIRLKKVDWHDLPVNKIEISTEESTKLTVEALIFNEETKEYEKLILIFSNITELEINRIILSGKSDMELYSFDFSKKEQYYCKLNFLCGWAEPDFEISLKCGKIELINPETKSID